MKCLVVVLFLSEAWLHRTCAGETTEAPEDTTELGAEDRMNAFADRVLGMINLTNENDLCYGVDGMDPDAYCRGWDWKIDGRRGE